MKNWITRVGRGMAWVVFTAGLGAQTGIISTIAGSTAVGGQPARGFSGDGGPAASALLALANLQNECDPNRYEQASHLFVDAQGNVYFTDSNNQRIRRITPQGIIGTVAGTGERPAINARCEPTGGAAAIGDGGPATAARFYNPAGIVQDSEGSWIVADQQNNRIRRISPGGQVTTIVGSGLHNLYAPNTPATLSPMDWPSAVALDSSGRLHFSEIHSHRVARIGGDGRLATVAGTGFPGFSGDGGQAASAQLFNPAGILVDSSGNVYIADMSNHRVRRIAPNGVITTVAGNGQAAFSGDGGPATSASLNQPSDVKLDARGNLYIADMLNHRIRRVDPAGVITTVAGDGRAGRGQDGVAANASSLNSPSALAIDAAGDLFIVDWQNYLIRKVSFGNLPVIDQGGIVNGASFAPAPVPVAPGSIITVFGSNFATSVVEAGQTPLPTSLAGVSLRINGNPAPLFFVSPRQINAQLPYEAASGQAAAVVATASGSSRSEAFTVAPAAAGIFQFGGTSRAIALNQDGTVNGPENPENRGNFVVMFLTGQGAVSPPVATGAAAPLTEISRATLPASATIGGEPAEVAFLGLTPGFIGLAQANLRVPAGISPGSAPVLLSVDGQASNSATIFVK